MILDAIVIAVLLAFIFWGSKRGMAKMVLSTVSFALSLVAGYVLYRPVSAFLGKMQIAEGLAAKLEESGAIARLPGVMKDIPFASSAAIELYRGVAVAAVTAISFLAVVIIVRFTLFFISLVVGVASNLPVIHQANSLIGGVLGFAMGLLVVLLFFAVIGVMEAFGINNIIGSLLADSNIAALIYNNNPLLDLIL